MTHFSPGPITLGIKTPPPLAAVFVVFVFTLLRVKLGFYAPEFASPRGQQRGRSSDMGLMQSRLLIPPLDRRGNAVGQGFEFFSRERLAGGLPVAALDKKLQVGFVFRGIRVAHDKGQVAVVFLAIAVVEFHQAAPPVMPAKLDAGEVHYSGYVRVEQADLFGAPIVAFYPEIVDVVGI